MPNITEIVMADAAMEDPIYVGDVDGDGEITPKDVTMLRRYMAQGWNVDVTIEDADVDSDGEITPKDVTMLRRYLAKGWGVVLPEKENTMTETQEETAKGITIDEVNFPDENFRKFVLEEIDAVEGDIGDGILDNDELSETVIDCSALDITDLTGIEYFTALRSLCCSDNSLEKIDLRHNTHLLFLNVEYNDLSELDISQNTELEQLYCVENENLQVLDLKNNNKLEELNCDKTLKLLNRTVVISEELFPDDVFREYVRKYDLNKNGYFDGDEINLVTGIDVSDKEIGSLEGIRTFRELVSLNCSNTKITSLNVAGMKIEKLDISMTPEITTLWCRDNYITELNISGCSNLRLVECSNNRIQTLDIRNIKPPMIFHDDGVEVVYFDQEPDDPYLKEETEKLYARIDEIIKQLGLSIDSPALLKVRKVHDWIIYNITYDYIWYYRFSQGITDYGIDIRDASDDNPSSPKWVLDNKLAICSGYAKLFGLYMERLGVKCIYLSSSEMDHAWNLVLMDDGYWYHIDTTWDDPGLPGLLSDKIEWNPGILRTRDFLRNDTGISEKHHGWTCDQEGVESDGNYYEENINHSISFYCENSTIEYDEEGYLKEISYIDADNRKYEYKYEKDQMVEEKVINTTETGEVITEKVYDKNRLKSEKETDHTENRITTLCYDEAGNLISKVVENLQGELMYSYDYEIGEDGVIQLSKYISVDGDETTYYDGNMRITEKCIRNQEGEVISEYTYDYYENGKKKQEIYTTSEGVVTTTCYNESGKYISITTVDTSTGEGSIIEYEYHENGKTKKITKKNLEGEIYDVKEYDEDGCWIIDNNGTGNQNGNEIIDFDW